MLYLYINPSFFLSCDPQPFLADRRPQTMASAAFSVFLCCFLFFFSFPYASSSSIGAESVVRESFPMDGDVAWVVQISDLHLSAYHPDRASDLVRLLAPALRVIRPALLLITGDITGRLSLFFLIELLGVLRVFFDRFGNFYYFLNTTRIFAVRNSIVLPENPENINVGHHDPWYSDVKSLCGM